MDKKKLGTIAQMTIMVFYGVYTMILGIQAYTKFSETTQAYLNIAANLGEQYVEDVQVSTTTCPSGYDSIFLWDWQGTNEGCDCYYSTYKKEHNGVYTKACNSTEISNNCHTVKAIQSKEFDSIEGVSDQKQQVCVKRGLKKFSEIAAEQTGTCSATQKLCGNPSNKETIICVGANDPCPVYSIQMSPTIDLIKYPTNEWKQLSLANGKYVFYNYNGLSANSLPTSEYRFSQSGVCKIKNTAKRMPSGATDYILSLSTRESCDETDDTFIETGFNIAENKYYKLNLQESQWDYMKVWSYYNVPTAVDLFKSYQRPFINWKTEARDSVQDLVDSADSIRSLKKAQLVVMVINIIVCILVSIILQFFQVYNLLGKDVPCIDGQGEAEMQRILLIKKVLTYGSKFLSAPFLFWAFSVSAKKKGILSKAADAEPSDARFNSELAVFSNQLNNDVYKNNLTALIVLLVTVLIDIALFLKEKYGKKKPENSTQVEPAKQEDEENANLQLSSDKKEPVNKSIVEQQQHQISELPSYNNYPPQTKQSEGEKKSNTELPMSTNVKEPHFNTPISYEQNRPLQQQQLPSYIYTAYTSNQKQESDVQQEQS